MSQLALVESLPLAPWSDVSTVARGRPLLAVRVPVKPHPKKRSGGGKTRGRFTPGPYRAWLEEWCRLLHAWVPADRREPIAIPVAFDVQLVYPRPQTLPRFVTVKGVRVPVYWHEGRVEYIGPADYDNALGGVFDGLVHAQVLLDDRLCVRPVGGGKWWAAAEGDGPCCEVRLWAARDERPLPREPVQRALL